MNKSIYLLQFDNGSDYEEHCVDTLVAFSDRTNAEYVLEVSNQTLQEFWENQPEWPDAQDEAELYAQKWKAREQYCRDANLPYGVELSMYYKGFYNLIEVALEN